MSRSGPPTRPDREPGWRGAACPLADRHHRAHPRHRCRGPRRSWPLPGHHAGRPAPPPRRGAGSGPPCPPGPSRPSWWPSPWWRGGRPGLSRAEGRPRVLQSVCHSGRCRPAAPVGHTPNPRAPPMPMSDPYSPLRRPADATAARSAVVMVTAVALLWRVGVGLRPAGRNGRGGRGGCRAGCRPDAGPAATPPATPTAPKFTLEWSTGALADWGGPIAESSPNVATLNGQGPAVVVGDRSGTVYAFPLTARGPDHHSRDVPGWPVEVGVPVTSTPSATVLGQQRPRLGLLRVGQRRRPDRGRVPGLRAPTASWSGSTRWWTPAPTPSRPRACRRAGHRHTAARRPRRGRRLARPGGVRLRRRRRRHALAGWPFFTSDSVFSTAAVGDLYGTGQDRDRRGRRPDPRLRPGPVLPPGRPPADPQRPGRPHLPLRHHTDRRVLPGHRQLPAGAAPGSSWAPASTSPRPPTPTP